MYKNFMECLVFSFLIVIYRDLDANTFFLTKIIRYIRIKLTRAIIPVTIEISNKYFVWKYFVPDSYTIFNNMDAFE